MDLRATACRKVSSTELRTRITNMSCVQTFTNLRINALLQQLLPTLGNLDVDLAFLLRLGAVRRGGSCTKHTAVFLRLLLFIGGVTAGMSIGCLVLGMTLAHHHDSLNVASRLRHCLLLVRHRQVLMWLVLDLPCATVSLEMMLLNVNCLLLFVRNLLPNKVFM
jgi:hypothetical protein